VAAFIEDNLIFGPGDLRGEPARLSPEKRALLYRMYEVYPDDHEQGGRRRFKRCALSMRKGTAKTEFAAWLAACELHPEAPVRTVSWHNGEPEGWGVDDPYIPLVAYTEEMTEDLAYAALRVVLEEGPLAPDFDIGLERILRRNGDGKAVALASSPNARDGARTTFQHFDETHRFVLQRLRDAHRTMMANLPKRRIADAWSLETTTAYSPGEGSVAESTMDYARSIEQGRIADPRLFFFHRAAEEAHDLTTDEGLRAAILEASGADAEWSDIEAIEETFKDPTSDVAYNRRVWLNQLVRDSGRAFDAGAFKDLGEERDVADRELIVLGFDGSRYEDATALVATTIRTGYQWIVGLWERPLSAEGEGWEVPSEDVTAAVEAAFAKWKVWRLYADPWGWRDELASWAAKWGTGKEGKIVEWPTNRWVATASAVKNYADAITTGDLRHNGSQDLVRHVGNACRRTLTIKDSDGRPIWVIQKERPDSPMKIDAAMAAVLSWEARRDAIAAGKGKPAPERLPIDGGANAENRQPEFAGVRGRNF
jgi:phage terminase large subunit-like protein